MFSLAVKIPVKVPLSHRLLTSASCCYSPWEATVMVQVHRPLPPTCQIWAKFTSSDFGPAWPQPLWAFQKSISVWRCCSTPPPNLFFISLARVGSLYLPFLPSLESSMPLSILETSWTAFLLLQRKLIACVAAYFVLCLQLGQTLLALPTESDCYLIMPKTRMRIQKRENCLHSLFCPQAFPEIQSLLLYIAL